MLTKILLGADVTEVYSLQRVSKLCFKFKLIPGDAFDLQNGVGFSKVEHRMEVPRIIKRDKRTVAIGSPPCTLPTFAAQTQSG